jgi:ribosome-binding protein aMBF1 (putative translation factor)
VDRSKAIECVIETMRNRLKGDYGHDLPPDHFRDDAEEIVDALMANGWVVEMSPADVRTRRKSKGWSQEQLAEALGSHAVTISNLERGKLPLTHEWVTRIDAVLRT